MRLHQYLLPLIYHGKMNGIPSREEKKYSCLTRLYVYLGMDMMDNGVCESTVSYDSVLIGLLTIQGLKSEWEHRRNGSQSYQTPSIKRFG